MVIVVTTLCFSARAFFSILSTGSMLLMMTVPLAFAGNLEMVEENVRELDELNKQAVQQIPDLPEAGTVDLKANVFYKDASPVLDVYEKTITIEKDEEINFNQGYTVDTEKGEKQ